MPNSAVRDRQVRIERPMQYVQILEAGAAEHVVFTTYLKSKIPARTLVLYFPRSDYNLIISHLSTLSSPLF